jgi:hypothetical protein
MIDSHIRKIVLVDQNFLSELKVASAIQHNAFASPSIDTKVITLDMSEAANMHAINELVKIIDPSELWPGNVLVRLDYSNQFVPIVTFTEELVPRRFGVFVQLCIALGAKRVKVSNVDEVDIEKSSHSATGAMAGGSAPGAQGKVDVNVETKDQHDEIKRSILKVQTEAEGGPPNMVEADRILDTYGLRHEALFMDIYNIRRVETNKTKSHTMSIDFTKDVRRFFDSSLKVKLQAMNAIYQGKIGFDKTRESVEKTKTATKLTVLVEF